MRRTWCKLCSSLTLAAIAWGGLNLLPVADVCGGDAKEIPSQEDLAELTADWWQWLLGQPASTNPALDLTGAFARQGQTGDVFFLAGAVALAGDPFSKSVQRTVTIPPGKAIFFPILNFEFANKDTPPGGFTEAQLRAFAAGPLDTATGVYATLDGVSLAPQIMRIKSPVFSYTLPKVKKGDLNLYQKLGLDITGTVDGTISDGYWVYLPPLSNKTSHILQFGGSEPTVPFTLDVTYVIKVP
jgi:hypothetical protein